MEYSLNDNNINMVLTSRIRLARNIDGMPFPHVLSREQADKIIEDFYSAIKSSAVNAGNNFRLIKLGEINGTERISLVEKHLISMDLANNHERAAVIISNDDSISIMINEEDHIRLQVLNRGFNLKAAYETANFVDDAIEDKITYAYDGNLGYLTSCPTNLGTGIRASVMLHLPALTMTKNINNIVNTVNQFGMTIRGFYGEGSNAMGNIYQISNQITLGLSEEEIINNLAAVTKKITDSENSARQIILGKQAIELEDDIFRSLGMLRYTRFISSSECLNLLSKVRMGIEIGMIKDMDISKIDDLFIKVQPAMLQLLSGSQLDNRTRDIERATLMRENI